MENSLVANPLTEVAAFRGKIYDSILDTIGMTPLVCLHQIIEEVGQRTEKAGKIIVTIWLSPPSYTYQQRYLTVFPKGNDASSS
jgi:hypothetical protein